MDDSEALLPPRCVASHALAASLSALLEGALAQASGGLSGNGQLSAADATAEAHRARTAASLELLRLKQLNRELGIATEDVRRHTSAKRAQVDEALLQLQNLAYEKAHLVKEIEVARDFRSTTAPIELVSAAAFEADEPSAAANAAAAAAAATSAAAATGGASDADSAAVVAAQQLQQQHHYHLHRLRHELAARQAMLAQVELLAQRRRTLAARNAARRAQLSGIGAHVESVLRAAAPLQSLLHVPADRIRPGVSATGSAAAGSGSGSGSALLALLPPPLYTLFCAAYAHRAAYAGEVEVRIDGDEAEARAWLAHQRASSSSSSSSSTDKHDADAEADDDDGDSADGSDDANGESAHKRAKTTVHGISWWPASRQPASSSSSSASSSVAGADDNDSATEAAAVAAASDDLFSRHPLRVTIQINAATESSEIAASSTSTPAPLLVMQFVYLHRLDMVTVTPSFLPSLPASSSSSSSLTPLSSLAHLLAPALDAGTALPLGKHDVLPGQRRARSAFDARAHGFAFRWAQQLCGLHAADPNPPLPPSPPSSSSSSSLAEISAAGAAVGVTASHLIAFADCVRACRVRVLARASLRRHTARLARLEYPFDFDGGNSNSATTRFAKQPPLPRTRFASFAPIALPSSSSASGHQQGSANALGGSDEVFRVVMQRAPLPDVEARVTVGANYPAVAPHFALRFLASATAATATATGAASWDAAAPQLARRADPASLQFVRDQQQQQHDEDDNDVLVGGSDRAAALRDLEREMNSCAHSVLNELFGSAEAAAAAAASAGGSVGGGGEASSLQGLLLPALIRKLQVCVDILADSESPASAAAVGSAKTAHTGAVDCAAGGGLVFERLVRGRDRRRPFWFNGLMFDQR